MQENLRAVVDFRQSMQKLRVGAGNKIFAKYEKDTTIPEEMKFLIEIQKEFEALETKLDKEMYRQVKHNHIVKGMVEIRGIGPILATKLFLMIDIEKAQHISSLWKYAGLSVTDGKADRLRKGEKSPFNVELKTVCFLIGDCMLKANSPYKDLYASHKQRLEIERPEQSPIHRHKQALRYMVKIFLSHVWLAWREYEGLPISQPYALGIPGHTHYIDRKDFGWTI